MTQVSVCQSQSKSNSVYPPPPLSVGGGGVKHPTKFKKGGLDKTSTFKGGCWEREGGFFQVEGGGEVQLSHHKLKSEIFNDKKSLLAKVFFFVITKNSN